MEARIRTFFSKAIESVRPGWLPLLLSEFEKPYFLTLTDFLMSENEKGMTIFPAVHHIFAALSFCDPEEIKVVVMGQDPYHGPGQAHGLAFSVMENQKIPPSLKNIQKEIHRSVSIAPASHGNLSYWAAQGVLLLNTVLTVRMHEADSHKKKGWEQFTGTLISYLSERNRNMVFALWGDKAIKLKELIKDQEEHLILETTHPSPLSCNRGFLGCDHFVKINDYLRQNGKQVIDWEIKDHGRLF